MDRMKDYRQLIRELPSSTIVCALGEFSPPTTAHELLVKTVKVVAEQRRADHTIFTSPSEVISEEKKEHFLQLMFPKTKFKSLSESFFSNTIKQLSEKYRRVVIVAGADQFAEFKKLKESSNVEIISIGDKDPDVDNPKMKQYATKGLYEDFKKLLPSTIRDIDGRRLMNEMRVGMQLEPIKEQINLVKDKLREKYFKGEIFNEGELVESDGKQYTIVKRGSNHLLLKEQTGELVSKWIHDVKPVKQKMKTEAVIQQSGTDKIDANAPEADTGAKKDPAPRGKTKGFLTFYNNTDDTVSEQVKPAETAALKARAKAAVIIKQAKEKEALKKKHEAEKDRLSEEDEVCPDCGKKECECEKDKSVDTTTLNPTFDPFFKEEWDLSEKDIDSMVENVSDQEIMDLYGEEELTLVYEDTGEEVDVHPDEQSIDLMEVLSRQERMKAKFRMRKSAAKRERSTKIALKRFSDAKTVNKRARRLAIKLMKKRMLRGRDPSKISVGERERIERALQKRKDTINRVAQKLVARVRKVEKARMSHGKTTKGAMPSVL